MKEAQTMYRLGMEHLASRRLEQAAGCFENALALIKQRGLIPSPKLLSYCGYALALARRKYAQGLSMCRAAARKEFFNPDLLYNLGEIHLVRGEKAKAHDTFCRGLALNPRHLLIRKRLKYMGIRQSPPLGFLPRRNFLNRMLGLSRRSRD